MTSNEDTLLDKATSSLDEAANLLVEGAVADDELDKKVLRSARKEALKAIAALEKLIGD